MTMRMSADGRAKLMQREGVKTKTYRDTEGVLTIGVGHTAAAGEPHPTPGLKISREQVDEILSRDLVRYENIVNRNIHAPLTQGQFDALTSICFNVEHALSPDSTVVRRLNAYDYAGAADAFLLYDKPKEIIGRRKTERAQFIAATHDNHLDRDLPRAVAPPRANGENVSPAYLRAAGSRTIAGADQVKTSLAGVATTVASATAVASQVQDVAGQVQSAADSVQSASGVLVWAEGHWKLIALAALLAAAGFFAWRIWRGASLVQHARVDDANSGLNIGR